MLYGNPQAFTQAEVIALEHKDYTPNEQRAAGDNFAHAPGKICKKCDRLIKPGQPARRRGESSWAHDVCPD
jgi:hypothetical protein